MAYGHAESHAFSGMSKTSFCQGSLSGQPFQGDSKFFEVPVMR